MIIRILDIVFSSIALIILMPIFFIVILILKFTGERKVFYKQDRLGLNNNIFRLFKFVTMLENSANLPGGTITVKDDPRILPIGKILRKTKINELPQLLNIFLGHMSFIGPRPFTKEVINLFPSNAEKILLSIKPGLSGISSIIFRNEEDILDVHNREEVYSNVIAPYKLELEKWFISNFGLTLYFKLIFLTIYVVIFPKSNILSILLKNLPEKPELLK